MNPSSAHAVCRSFAEARVTYLDELVYDFFMQSFLLLVHAQIFGRTLNSGKERGMTILKG
jgi:hypothetical protein